MKKRNVQRDKKKISVWKTFLITLVSVISFGILGMLGYFLIVGEPSADFVYTTQRITNEVEEDSLWKEIPAVDEQEMSNEDAYEQAIQKLSGCKVVGVQSDKPEVISFGFVGDMLFDDEYACMANLLNRGGTIENGMSEDLLADMRSLDVMMANNEFPYTDQGEPLEGKMYTFRADTESVHYLSDMGVDIVSLANNHAYDFGEEGLLDTLNTLETAGIPYVGAGRNLEEASQPVYFVSDEITVAVISATQIERYENPDTKGATENSAGVFRCLYPDKLCEVVADAKEKSDFVIVFIHWGTELEERPDWSQLEQAPMIAEAGADLIVGAHPHRLQGIEYYGDTPVAYSLGNFWFNSKSLDTGLLKVDISKEGIENLQFVPAVQRDCRTAYVYGTEKERILSYMNSISYNANIDNEGYITKK